MVCCFNDLNVELRNENPVLIKAAATLNLSCWCSKFWTHISMTKRDLWNSDVAIDIIKPHLGQEGALLPILHDLQEAFGHIPEVAVPMVAEALNLSRAEVHGVVTFY